MGTKYLEPSSAGLRKPTDAQKSNGQIDNPPRYCEFGGLDKPSRVAQKNHYTIKKANGRG